MCIGLTVILYFDRNQFIKSIVDKNSYIYHCFAILIPINIKISNVQKSSLAKIAQIMSNEPISLDLIAEKTSLDTGTLLASLSQLELMGLVSQLPGMLYVIA